MSAHHTTAEWQRVRKENRPRIEAQLPRACIDCGRPVRPGQKWQVGHIIPVARAKQMGWSVQQINHPSNLGPTHAKAPGQRACNQIAGGRLGAKATSQTKREQKRFLPW